MWQRAVGRPGGLSMQSYTGEKLYMSSQVSTRHWISFFQEMKLIWLTREKKAVLEKLTQRIYYNRRKWKFAISKLQKQTLDRKMQVKETVSPKFPGRRSRLPAACSTRVNFCMNRLCTKFWSSGHEISLVRTECIAHKRQDLLYYFPTGEWNGLQCKTRKKKKTHKFKFSK